MTSRKKNINEVDYTDRIDNCTKIFITWRKSFIFLGTIIISLTTCSYLFARNMGDVRRVIEVKSVKCADIERRVDIIEKNVEELKKINTTLNAIADKLNVGQTK